MRRDVETDLDSGGARGRWWPGGDDDGARGAELFDPTTNAWSAAGTMNAARSEADAVLLGAGRVAGEGGAGRSRGELWSPATNSGSVTAPVERLRSFTAAVRLPDGRGLVGSPWVRYYRDISELYDVAA